MANFTYPYVRTLNRPLNNFVIEKLVNDFIAKDKNKAYAFEVNYISQPSWLAVSSAQIKVFKPDYDTETLVYIGTVNAGTGLSPSDLDTGATSPDTPPCTFQQYWQ